MAQAIGDEVADGEMRVEFHVRPDESKAARDGGRQAGRSAQRAQHFRGALAFGVGIRRIERIGPSCKGFTYMAELRRLAAVNCARTDEQKSGGRTGDGELQRAARAFDNRVEHDAGGFVVQRGAGLGRGMDDM